MATKHHHTINEICNSHTALGKILQKSALLNSLTEQIKPLLNEPLRQHVRVANYRDKCLILAVDKAIWVTELRYCLPDLLQALQSKNSLAIESIEWLIAI